MYTISNGPSKIVAKTRRGLHQNYQKFEKINENGNKRASNNNSVNSPKSVNNNPRPTFQPIRKLNNHHSTKAEETVITPQHEELIKYISDSWNMVLASNPFDVCTEDGSSNASNGFTKNSNNITTTTTTTTTTTIVADANNNTKTGAYTSSMCTKSSVTTNGNKPSLSSSPSSSLHLSTTNPNEDVEIISSGSSLSSEIMDSMVWPTTASLPMSAPFVYSEPQSLTLTDFKPFDLEAWWGRRLFNNITQGAENVKKVDALISDCILNVPKKISKLLNFIKQKV